MQGLWAAHLDPELGGQGFGQLRLGLLHEVLGRSELAPFVFGCQAPDSGNAELIALAGTEEQKRRWLDPLLDGRILSAFAMTEQGTGSDPRQFTTRAERDGDEWVITGRKWMVGNASRGDLHIVLAVTEPDADPHHRMSMLLVPRGSAGDRGTRSGPHERPRRGREPGVGAWRGHLRPRAGAGRESARRPRRGVHPRPASPRARSHPPLHALGRGLPARLRHARRACGVDLGARRPVGRQADRAELGGRQRRGHRGGPACSPCRRRGVSTRSARPPRAPRSR